VRAQHNYRLRPYDGRVALFAPAGFGRKFELVQIQPYVHDLYTRALPLGTGTPHTRALAENFPVRMRSHYVCMRDDTFVHHLARELDALVAPGPQTRGSEQFATRRTEPDKSEHSAARS
jgi:hypothetical protein